MLLRCCFIHLIITILRHTLYLLDLCPCLGLCIFISYLCDLFFIFSLIFIVINHIPSLKQSHFFLHFLEDLLIFLDNNKKANIFKKWKFNLWVMLSFCLIFCQFQPGVAYKSVACEKSVHLNNENCRSYPAGIYLLKVNNKNTRTRG